MKPARKRARRLGLRMSGEEMRRLRHGLFPAVRRWPALSRWGAAADSSGEITLEPLRKFPRIRDLQVDRGACFAALQEMELWLEEEADLTNRARRELHYRRQAA